MQLKPQYGFASVMLASVIAFGLTIGVYWLIDAVLLAGMASTISWICLKKINWASPSIWDSRGYEPRSRIMHFHYLSRIKGKNSLKDLDPFEKALLSEIDWLNISNEDLRGLGRSSAIKWKAALLGEKYPVEPK